MGSILSDDRELRRLNQAIAAFDARPDHDRLRMHHLLSALLEARSEIEVRTDTSRAAVGRSNASRPASHGVISRRRHMSAMDRFSLVQRPFAQRESAEVQR